MLTGTSLGHPGRVGPPWDIRGTRLVSGADQQDGTTLGKVDDGRPPRRLPGLGTFDGLGLLRPVGSVPQPRPVQFDSPPGPCLDMSSPGRRGWSRVCGQRRAGRRVVPAGAGLFCCSPNGSNPDRALPRPTRRRGVIRSPRDTSAKDTGWYQVSRSGRGGHGRPRPNQATPGLWDSKSQPLVLTSSFTLLARTR
jgi:hypothetical protein